MYIRMIMLTIISLYTSRVVLQELGVKDYGIYNVLGSVVLMFNSLRTIFASSTQRFLSYEIGCGKRENLRKVFNLSIQMNLLIVLIFVIISEIFGLWFVEYKLNIDIERLITAHYVLQFSQLM